jgi:signal peptidase I
VTGVQTCALPISVVPLALLGGLWVRADVGQVQTVTSSSMSPTLCKGDRVVVQEWGVSAASLHHDDLVVFDEPGTSLRVVKRVVGLPGDVVEIRDAKTFRNGRRVVEPYVDRASIDALYYGPVTVPQGQILVLGDNRATSVDSRHYGTVPADRVDGMVRWHLSGSC